MVCFNGCDACGGLGWLLLKEGVKRCPECNKEENDEKR